MVLIKVRGFFLRLCLWQPIGFGAKSLSSLILQEWSGFEQNYFKYRTLPHLRFLNAVVLRWRCNVIKQKKKQLSYWATELYFKSCYGSKLTPSPVCLVSSVGWSRAQKPAVLKTCRNIYLFFLSLSLGFKRDFGRLGGTLGTSGGWCGRGNYLPGNNCQTGAHE